jgi:hypothetical protein
LKKIEDKGDQKLDFQLICSGDEFGARCGRIEPKGKLVACGGRVSAVVVRVNFEGLEVNEH